MRSGLYFLAAASSASALTQVPLSLQTIPYQLTHLVTPPRPAGKAVVPVPETDDAGFWFANFGIGADKSKSMLIDTGSSDVYINPGNIYHPGPKAQNLHRQFRISFATTNSDGSGSETLSGDLWRDLVSLSSLSIPNQELGNVTKATSLPAFPHDGLVGFAGQDSSAFAGVPWFQSVCNAGLVSQCRFGLAFKTDNTGVQTFGGVDPKYASSLSTARISNQWETTMNVVAAGKTVESGVSVQFDSGTTVIYGPIDQVKAVYTALGIPTATKSGDPSYLYGYYPCDKPPTAGFTLGGKTFNIVPSAWSAKNNGNNNCTGVIQGTDAFGDLWLVGQAFFQGRYIDHNIDGGTMGFANL